MPEPVVICFSGGKDSALAVRAIQDEGRYEAVALLTTVTSDYSRVSMHGVRRALLHDQADALRLPLTEVAVPAGASNEIYEIRMARALRRFGAEGVRHVVFGDIFLEDLRAYREEQTGKVGLRCLFPLWQRDTAELARAFIDAGFVATVVCVNTEILDASCAGRAFDHRFVDDLPAGVDPCGENGEFHTFVSGGPIFAEPLVVSAGPVVTRGRFVYCDIHSRAVDPTLSSGKENA